ncbi:MAG: DHH family phosphoesterase [Anaerolineae bacterium]|nr:DHH family phosphoesterase [Anaerolineae bacterium]
MKQPPMEARIAHRIASARRVLVVAHISPDGDAIGSLLGLGLALRRRSIDAVLACADPVPEQYHYLPHWESITAVPEGPFDLLVSLDSSDLRRLGHIYEPQILSDVPILNVDHHATNCQFGALNWVEPGAAATAQMLVRLVGVLGVAIDAEIGTCLLTGLVADTLGFRTSTTSPEVIETALDLMRAGASLTRVMDQIFGHRPVGLIRLWSLALQRLHLDGHVLWSEVTQDMRTRAAYTEDGDAGLVSFLITADEADMAVVFTEAVDGRIEVSMRASPAYDVSRVALSLGGGGHPQAAGCTLPGPLEAARERVLPCLHEAWHAQTAGR